jgi:hypothetical protein
MLTIKLDCLPPREFSPNSRVHWRTRHRAGVQAKNDVIALVLEQGWQGPALCDAVVSIRWGLPTKRVVDWDNLVARSKPYLDALVDAGVLVGDSVRDYTPEYGWFQSPRKPVTIIAVRRQDGSEA